MYCSYSMYTQYSIHSHVSTMLAKVETIFFGYHGKCQGQQKTGGGAGLKDSHFLLKWFWLCQIQAQGGWDPESRAVRIGPLHQCSQWVVHLTGHGEKIRCNRQWVYPIERHQYWQQIVPDEEFKPLTVFAAFSQEYVVYTLHWHNGDSRVTNSTYQKPVIDGTDATNAVGMPPCAVSSVTAALIDPNKHIRVIQRYFGHKFGTE